MFGASSELDSVMEFGYLRARRAAERGVYTTIAYCSQDNSRVSTDRGSLSLTRYVRGAAVELLTARSKHFAPHNLRLWLR